MDSDKPNADLAAHWTAMKNAWEQFAESMDKFAGTAGTGGPAAAPPPPASDPALVDRESRLMAQIGSLIQNTTMQVNQLQSAYMSNPWSGPQVTAQLIQAYQTTIAGLEQLKPEAQALANAGRKDALNFLNAHEADNQKALGIMTGMVGQQQQADANQAAIWAQSNKSVTDTLIGMNQKMQDAYDKANQKFMDYIRG